MSDLYKEAIADAKKLRELAEEDARKSIMEKVSPYIKKMIAKETANATSFFFEEEEDAALQSAEPASSEVEAPPVDAAPVGAVDANVSDIPSTPDAPVEAPISAVGSETANIPLPDSDGKITIDFEQLFASPSIGDTVAPVNVDAIAPGAPLETTPPASEAPIDATSSEPAPMDTPPELPTGGGTDIAPDSGEMPPASPDLVDTAAAAPPEEEEELPPAPAPVVESLDKFKSRLADAAFGIDRVYHGTRVADITHERLKNNLMGLLESLDRMLENGVISESQARHNEKRLEFLFLKLKEGSLTNSYKTEKDKKEDPMGKSLKEYAAKLFESDDQERLAQDGASTGKTGVVVHKDASVHAKETSGVSPELSDLFKEELEGGSQTVAVATKSGTVDEPALPGTGKADKKPLEQGKPAVTEEVEAKGHAGFGDSSEKPVASPDMFFEIDEKELMEAVAAIRKENAAKAAKADKGGWETAKPAAKSASPKSVLGKETVKEQASMGGGMEEDLVLNVSLPDELESELDADDLDVDLMLSDDEMDLEAGEEGEEMLDVDGEEEEEMEMDLSSDESDLDMDGGDMESEEEEMLLTDEEEDLDEVSDSPMTGPATDQPGKRPGALAEARARKAAHTSRGREKKAMKLLEAHRAQTKQLKSEMAETNLFLSKLLYLNKFLQREGLSRKVKQQIVEHLDRAGNLAEAKDIYLKIKRKLDESVNGTSSGIALAGSAAKPTAGGSAKLQESSNAASAGDETIVGTWERWQKLAKISKGES